MRCCGRELVGDVEQAADESLGFGVEIGDGVGAHFLDRGAIDGRRGEQFERLLAHRLMLGGIGRDFGEFGGDDVMHFGFLRRVGADGIERMRNGALDHGEAHALFPAEMVSAHRRHGEAAGAERDAADEDADKSESARARRKSEPAVSSGSGCRNGGSGGKFRLSISVMAISFIDGVRRRFEKEFAGGRFRAIRPNVKNDERTGALWRRPRSGPSPGRRQAPG